MATVKDIVKQFPFIYPAGIVQSCREWIDQENASKGVYFGARTHSYKLIEQIEGHTHHLPQLQDQNDATEFGRNIYYDTAPAYLFNLKDVYVYKQMGLVFSNRNCLFQEFTHHFNISSLSRLIYSKPFFTFSNRIKRLNGLGAMLLSPQSHNYYHWMSDVLPRINLYESVLGHIDHFCISASVPQKFVDVLSQFGIPDHKICLVTDTEKLHFDNFYVASLPGSEGRSPKWAIDYVRKKLLKHLSTVVPDKKIYLKRGNNVSRKIVNEAEVVNLVTKYGFDIIDPDDLSVLEQASLFNRAKVVIGAHGAGLTNLMFVQPGATVIELFSPDYFRSDCYFTLARLLNLNYHYIKGAKSEDADWGDMTIDSGQLTNLITVL